MRKIKIILDTDPGVDDSTGIIYALMEPRFDIKLISTCFGNIDVHTSTRNVCHILDLLNKDVPVVKGYEHRLSGSTEDATFLHTKEGMGGYIPPKRTKHKAIEKDCADAIYEVLKENPKEIVFCILGPHTNFAHLLIKHPDAKDLIKSVLMMGGAPTGIKADPNHCSFNIRTDIPAFKHTIESGLPIAMVPSCLGRDWGYFTEQQVEQLKNTNDVGKLMAKTYETYWEPNYDDRRIATNDVCALYYLVYPRFYKMKRADIELNLETGRTIGHFKRDGQFKVAVGLNRKKFMKMLFSKLEKFDVKISGIDRKRKVAEPKWTEDVKQDYDELPKKKKTAGKKTTASKTTKTRATQKTPTKKTTTSKTTAKKNSGKPARQEPKNENPEN